MVVFAFVLVLTLSVVSAFSFGEVLGKITGSAVEDSESDDKIIFYATSEIYGGNLGGREGADDICEDEKPSGLSCDNLHAFLSVGEDDEIKDLPYSYKYSSTKALYWYNHQTGALTKFANNLSDALDGSIEVDARTGTGRPLYYHYWTGASSNGALNVDWDINGNDYAAADGWTNTERYGTRGNADRKDHNWITNTGKYAGTRDDGALLCVCGGTVSEDSVDSAGDEEEDDVQRGIINESQEATLGCVDSDEGRKRSVKGNVSFFAGVPPSETFAYDSCIDNENLKEVYCDGQNVARYEIAECANGCRDDGCIPGTAVKVGQIVTVENKKISVYSLRGDVQKVRLNVSGELTSLLAEGERHVLSDGCIIGIWALQFDKRQAVFWINCGGSVDDEDELEDEEDSEEVEDDSLEDEASQECDANECESEGKCYSLGYRKGNTYCGEEAEFMNQLSEDESCENDFECESNICLSDICVDRGFLQSIIEFFKNLFSGE